MVFSCGMDLGLTSFFFGIFEVMDAYEFWVLRSFSVFLICSFLVEIEEHKIQINEHSTLQNDKK